MGCFSRMCKECKKPILSNSSTGQQCVLFYLKNGIVEQRLAGEYNSYGAVFGQFWTGCWNDLVKDHFNNNSNTGFAYYHKSCWEKAGKPAPTTISKDDPNQGWGNDHEYLLSDNPNPIYK